MLQRVEGAVNARSLAVPDAEDTIDGGLRKQVGLLAAPDGGNAQILVQAGLEVDVVLRQILLRPPQRRVVLAKR